MKRDLTRFCPICEETKDLHDFYFSSAYGLYQNICKECDKDRKRRWYLQHKEAVDKKRKQWQVDNYDLHLEHQRRYNNSEKGIAARRKYQEKLKEERLEKRKLKEKIESKTIKKPKNKINKRKG